MGRDARVYTITNSEHVYKVHVSVHEYGDRTKLSAKSEEKTKAVDRRTWFCLQLTAKLNNNWMNILY